MNKTLPALSSVIVFSPSELANNKSVTNSKGATRRKTIDRLSEESARNSNNRRMIDPSANKNSLASITDGYDHVGFPIANINYHTYRYDRLSRLFGSIERCTKSQEGDRRKERFTPSSCQNEEILSTRHYFPKADALLSISSFVESFRRSYVRACTLFRSPLEADVIFHFTK